MNSFRKRVITPDNYAAILFNGLRYLLAGFRSILNPKTSRALQEEILVAVSKVNHCRYCEWGHTVLAVNHGVDIEELEHLLDTHHSSRFSEGDITAIMFAQHFADSEGDIDKDALNRLYDYFTPEGVQEIIRVVHVITVGNLLGNTLDAFLLRLKGKKVEGSHILIELCAFIFGSVILVIAAPIILTKNKKHIHMEALD